MKHLSQDDIEQAIIEAVLAWAAKCDRAFLARENLLKFGENRKAKRLITKAENHNKSAYKAQISILKMAKALATIKRLDDQDSV